MDTYQKPLLPLVGWTTLVAGIVALIGFVFLLLFFALEASTILEQGESSPPLFGTLNDASYIFVSLLLLPLALVLYRSTRADSPALSLVVLVIGAVGLAAIAIIQALYVPRLIQSPVAGPALNLALGVLGLWLILVTRLDTGLISMPRALAWLGTVTGVAMILLPIGYYLGGGSAMLEDPTVAMSKIPVAVMLMFSMLGIGLGLPIWAILTGRWMLKRTRR